MSRASAEAVGVATSRRWMVAASLIAVMASELLVRSTGIEIFGAAAWCAALLTVVVSRRELGLREAYLLSLCAAVTAALLVLDPEPARVVGAALDQAAFLMAFILLLALLHEAAATSPSIAECGAYLIRQPPVRRYYALNGGTGVMAVLFNIGLVSFLVPLIQRGVRAASADQSQREIAERRQISAMLRGFAWSVIWSPTALAPLALLELIPGIDRRLWITIGLAIFLVMMVLGAVEDGLRYRVGRSSEPRPAVRFPVKAALRFLAACTWLLAMTLVVVWVTGDTIVFGLMLACPAMLVGWVAVQSFGKGEGWPETGARMAEIVFFSLPKSAPVAVTLACSGFIGRAAAGLVPAEELASALRLEAMPDYLLLSLLPVALSLLSLLGLSPIMMAVFFGTLFGSLSVPPADPTLIALAISCGWALSMTFSPFATVVLLTARVGGIRPTKQTWRWNLAFSAIAAAALVPIFALITGGR